MKLLIKTFIQKKKLSVFVVISVYLEFTDSYISWWEPWITCIKCDIVENSRGIVNAIIFFITIDEKLNVILISVSNLLNSDGSELV